MKVKSVLRLLCLVLWTVDVGAASISATQAQTVAQQFLLTHASSMRAPSHGGTTLSLAHEAMSANGETDFFVFNRGVDGGYVIVAGDDSVLPVWAYVDRGAFVPAELPENLRWWLGEYQRELQWLRNHPSFQPRRATTVGGSVNPLLKTMWNQCKPFNNQCPSIPDGGDAPYGYRAPSGCVAVATAQIMKYYAWPNRGSGSHSYSTDVFYGDDGEFSYHTTLSANFGEHVYDWSQMKDYYYFVNNYNTVYARNIDETGLPATSAQCEAVAQLMSDLGITLEMSYSNSGSGASTGDVPAVLATYFDYEDSMIQLYRDYYSGDWDQLLRSEVDNQRPLLYRGEND